MNAIAQQNQLNKVAGLQHSVGSLFSRSGVQWSEHPLRAAQRIPLVAVSENARRYALKAELPQVKLEDVKITLDDDTLTITGDREFDLNRKKGQPVEHAGGRFAHRFAIPADARPPRSAPCLNVESSQSILPRVPVPFSPPALMSPPSQRCRCEPQGSIQCAGARTEVMMP